VRSLWTIVGAIELPLVGAILALPRRCDPSTIVGAILASPVGAILASPVGAILDSPVGTIQSATVGAISTSHRQPPNRTDNR
jgi:hypothetical protein